MPESIRSSRPAEDRTTQLSRAGGPTIVFESDQVLVATTGSYVILINGGDLADAGVKGVRDAFERMNPEVSIGYLVVLEPEITLMLPPDVRSSIAEILASFAARIAAVAVCFEGTGFKATGIRSIATAIQLASRATFPHKTFATLADAVAFVSGALPPGALPEAQELTREVEHLRRRARG